MCEIYFIKPLKTKINLEDLKQLGIMLEEGSKINKDGYGITNGTKIYKNENKFTNEEYFKEIKSFIDSKFIIGHTRLGTTGKTKKINSHPFYNKRFIWLHNGIIQNHEVLTKRYNLENINVDSQIIGEILLKESLKQPKKEIHILLKELLKEVIGSLSVFLYDKYTKRLYYLKNEYTNFQFRILENINDKQKILIGCTDKDKLDYSYRIDTEKNCFGISLNSYRVIAYFEPHENIIYEITNNEVKKLCKFKNQAYTYVYEDSDLWNYGYGNYGYGNMDNRLLLEESIKEESYSNRNITYHKTLSDIIEILEEFFKVKIDIQKIKTIKGKRYRLVILSDTIEYEQESIRQYIMQDSGIDITNNLRFIDLENIVNNLEFILEYYGYNKGGNFYE